VWRASTAEAAVAARRAGGGKALRPILGDRAGAAAFARAAGLLIKAAASAPFEARPMDAAPRAIAVPGGGAARLFHAGSWRREHRGGGHIAALMTQGAGGLAAHVLPAPGRDRPAEKPGRIGHLRAAQLAAVTGGTRDRGLTGDDGWLSEPGRAARQRAGARTGDLAARPGQSLEPDEPDELTATPSRPPRRYPPPGTRTRARAVQPGATAPGQIAVRPADAAASQRPR
jgi:helix-turn-helix protein